MSFIPQKSYESIVFILQVSQERLKQFLCTKFWGLNKLYYGSREKREYWFDWFLTDVKKALVDDGRVFDKKGAVISSKYKWPTTTVDGKTFVFIPFVEDSGMFKPGQVFIPSACLPAG